MEGLLVIAAPYTHVAFLYYILFDKQMVTGHINVETAWCDPLEP